MKNLKLLGLVGSAVGAIAFTQNPSFAQQPPVEPCPLQLRVSDPEQRYSGAITAGLTGQTARCTIPQLLDLLKDQQPSIRNGAVYALTQMGDCRPIAAPYLIPMLGDADKLVRLRAAYALGWMGKLGDRIPPECFSQQPPTDIAKTTEELRRSITRLSANGAENPLLPLLKDSDAGVRMSAIDALGMVGATGTTSLITPLLDDPSLDVRQSAANTLRKLGNQTR
jgi:HEAT repeat protein